MLRLTPLSIIDFVYNVLLLTSPIVEQKYPSVQSVFLVQYSFDSSFLYILHISIVDCCFNTLTICNGDIWETKEIII